MLMIQCHPLRTEKTGKNNYSVRREDGACFQVQMQNKSFFVTKLVGGTPFRPKGSSLVQSPCIAWAQCKNLEDAVVQLELRLRSTGNAEPIGVLVGDDADDDGDAQAVGDDDDALEDDNASAVADLD